MKIDINIDSKKNYYQIDTKQGIPQMLRILIEKLYLCKLIYGYNTITPI